MAEGEREVDVHAIYAEIGKIRGEIGELRGSFTEFRERVLNELGDVRKDIKALENRLWAFLTSILIAVIISIIISILKP